MNAMHPIFNIKTTKDLDTAFDLYLSHMNKAHNLNLANQTKAQHKFADFLGFDSYGSLKSYIERMTDTINFDVDGFRIDSTVYSVLIPRSSLTVPANRYFESLFGNGTIFNVLGKLFDDYDSSPNSNELLADLIRDHYDLSLIGEDFHALCRYNTEHLIIWLSLLVEKNEKALNAETPVRIGAEFDNGGISDKQNLNLDFDATSYFESKMSRGLLSSVLKNHYFDSNMGYFYDKSILTLSMEGDKENAQKLEVISNSYSDCFSPYILIDSGSIGSWLLSKLEVAYGSVATNDKS